MFKASLWWILTFIGRGRGEHEVQLEFIVWIRRNIAIRIILIEIKHILCNVEFMTNASIHFWWWRFFCFLHLVNWIKSFLFVCFAAKIGIGILWVNCGTERPSKMRLTSVDQKKRTVYIFVIIFRYSNALRAACDWASLVVTPDPWQTATGNVDNWTRHWQRPLYVFSSMST